MTDEKTRTLHAAFGTNDGQLDGHVFVGVSSTRIYCRPICRAKQPRIENCTFYASAALAERDGYRPCLLCRPELAPRTPRSADISPIAYEIGTFLEEYAGDPGVLGKLPNRFGLTWDEITQRFQEGHGVSVEEYLGTCRLHLAKQILTDTDLEVTDIYSAVGFPDAQTLEETIKKRYRLDPAKFRRRGRQTESSGEITLTLSYRPPFRWEQILGFFAGRTIPGVEKIEGGEYFRIADLVGADGEHVYGWLRVGHEPGKNSLSVTLDHHLLPVLSQLLARVRRLFDLSCDPLAVSQVLTSMSETKPGLFIPGTRLPGCFDSFEMVVRAVLGQQITVKAANTLAGRFVQAYGIPVASGIDGLSHAFPRPGTILALDGPIDAHLGPHGITKTRARTILGLARAISERSIPMDSCVDPEGQMKMLIQLPGIGEWTANYIAMRSMGWGDGFPHTDYGVKKALEPRGPKEILALAEAWRPYRAYATMALWGSL